MKTHNFHPQPNLKPKANLKKKKRKKNPSNKKKATHGPPKKKKTFTNPFTHPKIKTIKMVC